MATRVVRDDDRGREDAARTLRAGGIVALPTDTVYGIGVDLAAAGGIERLFEAKRRPTERAIVLLLADAAQARELATWPTSAERLASAFWPGGLTIVVEQRADRALPKDLTGGRTTIGLRVPDHPCPRALAASIGPLPVTSANVSGAPDALSAAEVVEQLGEAVDLVLDGGRSAGGRPSTVVDCSGDRIRILRAGAISATEIEDAL